LFVYISSLSAVSSNLGNHTFFPTSSYGFSKSAFESYLSVYYDHHLIVRPGPLVTPNNLGPFRFFRIFLNSLVFLPANVNSSFPLTSLKDLALFLHLSITYPSCRSKIVNVISSYVSLSSLAYYFKLKKIYIVYVPLPLLKFFVGAIDRLLYLFHGQRSIQSLGLAFHSMLEPKASLLSPQETVVLSSSDSLIRELYP
jgi:nucleoside-diphosphate-sugar epimerase